MFKAMIVDDEIDIRQGLARIIRWEDYGFSIAGQAADGLEALELFKKERPDLVLTDVKMPEMDGLALTKELKSIDRDVGVIILSGYNDFTYAREAIKYGVNSYLLKPVDTDELCNELCSIRDKILSRKMAKRNEKEKLKSLKGLFLFKLAHNEIEDNDVEDRIKEYDLKLDYKSVCVAIIEFDDYREYELNLTSSEINQRKSIVKSIIEDILAQHDCGYLFDEVEHQYGLLFGTNDNAPGREAIWKMLSGMVDSVWQRASEHISIGMGNSVKSLAELTISYRQAQKALERKLFSKSMKVFNYVDEDEFGALSAINWSSKELISHVRNCKKDLVLVEVDLLFNELEEKCISISSVRYIITDIITSLAKTVIENGGDWKNLRSTSFKDIESILQNSNPQMIKKYTLELCLKIGDFFEVEKLKNSKNILDRVLPYIDKHFHEEISLKKLADQFFINQFYLGQLIKKKKGMNFNDYLNSIRIETAKRLLSDESLSIKEISERIGYKYVDHFYKNFKEITGTNPGEFRKGNFSEM